MYSTYIIRGYGDITRKSYLDTVCECVWGGGGGGGGGRGWEGGGRERE